MTGINVLRFILGASLAFLFVSCTPTRPTIHYAGENSITLKYHAYDLVPTLTAEAIDMAIEHCKAYGKGMKHVSSQAVNPFFSSAELHTFLCTDDFVDTRIELDIN